MLIGEIVINDPRLLGYDIRDDDSIHMSLYLYTQSLNLADFVRMGRFCNMTAI